MNFGLKALLALCIAVMIGGVAGLIYVNYSLDQVRYHESSSSNFYTEDNYEEDEIDESTADYATASSDAVTWETVEDVADSEGIYNILLCGEENIKGSDRGRTDSMILVSVNMNTKQITLISIMRDMYVQIPGFNNNKLNAAYRIGGMTLLQETIERNFGVAIDGYVLVNFDQFEYIVDLLGGVDLDLTYDEVEYLKLKEVIDESVDSEEFSSKTQTLNGAQALWYSRIRYVRTSNNLRDDYGRTYRQRSVLNALYQKYSDISYMEMLAILPDIMSTISTDLSKTELVQLGANVLSLKNQPIRMTSIPFQGTYQGMRLYGMSVLYLNDMDQIRIKLQKIIEGEDIDTVINTYYETDSASASGDADLYNEIVLAPAGDSAAAPTADTVADPAADPNAALPDTVTDPAAVTTDMTAVPDASTTDPAAVTDSSTSEPVADPNVTADPAADSNAAVSDTTADSGAATVPATESDVSAPDAAADAASGPN